jgi:uncharacterized cupredoxin-like copper-binding protein
MKSSPWGASPGSNFDRDVQHDNNNAVASVQLAPGQPRQSEANKTQFGGNDMKTGMNRRASTPKRLTIILGGVAGAALVAGLAACGSNAATSTAPQSSSSSAPVSGDQTATLSEWKIVVPTSIKAGKVNFKIVNAGTIEHEMVVFKADLDLAAYPTDDAGALKEEDPSITKASDGENIAAGASEQRTIDLSKPGRYLFVCNLPTHFKLGMATIVTVS